MMVVDYIILTQKRTHEPIETLRIKVVIEVSFLLSKPAG